MRSAGAEECTYNPPTPLQFPLIFNWKENFLGWVPPLDPTMGFGKQGTGQIIREKISNAALGALAGEDVVKIASDVTLVDDFRILKSEIIAVILGLTTSEGTGLILGMANGELSAAEVEECLEIDGPVNPNDRERTEKAMRNCKNIAFAVPGNLNTEMVFENDEGGRLITMKHRWTYNNPEGWDYYVYNIGAALTTGATVQLVATHFGVWVT